MRTRWYWRWYWRTLVVVALTILSAVTAYNIVTVASAESAQEDLGAAFFRAFVTLGVGVIGLVASLAITQPPRRPPPWPLTPPMPRDPATITCDWLSLSLMIGTVAFGALSGFLVLLAAGFGPEGFGGDANPTPTQVATAHHGQI